MEAVRSWAIGLCVAAVGCAVLQLLAPKGGLGKLYHLLTAAFFLCCLVFPILAFQNLPELSIDTLPEEIQQSMLEERIRQQLVEQIDEALQTTTAQVLESYGFQAEKVVANTTTSEEGGIYMDSVTVYLDKENVRHALTIRLLLEQRLGVTVTIADAE